MFARKHHANTDSLLGRGDEPPIAAHLVTPRALYTHHGIYVGDGCVIHYAGFARGLRRGPVEVVSLDDFARGRGVRVRPAPRIFEGRQVVERARSRLGERRYRILTNNCEHFCAWVLRDEVVSAQVQRLIAILQRLTPRYRPIPSSNRFDSSCLVR